MSIAFKVHEDFSSALAQVYFELGPEFGSVVDGFAVERPDGGYPAAPAVLVAHADVAEIDEFNILQATLLAMRGSSSASTGTPAAAIIFLASILEPIRSMASGLGPIQVRPAAMTAASAGWRRSCPSAASRGRSRRMS